MVADPPPPEYAEHPNLQLRLRTKGLRRFELLVCLRLPLHDLELCLPPHIYPVEAAEVVPGSQPPSAARAHHKGWNRPLGGRLCVAEHKIKQRQDVLFLSIFLFT